MTSNLPKFTIDEFLAALSDRLRSRGDLKLSKLFIGSGEPLVHDHRFQQGGLAQYIVRELGDPTKSVEEQSENLENLTRDQIQAAVISFFSDRGIQKQLGTDFANHQPAALELTANAITNLFQQRNERFETVPQVMPLPSFVVAENLQRNFWRDFFVAVRQWVSQLSANIARASAEKAQEKAENERRAREEQAENERRLRATVALKSLLVTLSGDALPGIMELVEHGANVNVYGEVSDKWAPLHFAAIYGYTHHIRNLIEAGANPDQQNARGHTALHLAARYNDVTIIAALVEADADPTITTTLTYKSDSFIGIFDYTKRIVQPLTARELVQFSNQSEPTKQQIRDALRQAELDWPIKKAKLKK